MQREESYLGGNMSLSNRARVAIVGVFSALASLSVLGQGWPPGVTPEMLDQLRSMPPAQPVSYTHLRAHETS